MPENIYMLFLAGAFGALVKDLVKDGYFRVPHFKDGHIYMGFLAGAIIGGFVGVVVDHSYITALLGGYTGISVIDHLVKK